MADPRRSEAARWLRQNGWEVAFTRGGHLRADHPDASGPLFTGSTPGDHRHLRHVRTQARRLLRNTDAEEA